MSEVTDARRWKCSMCSGDYGAAELVPSLEPGISACPQCNFWTTLSLITIPAHGAPDSFIRRVQENPQIALEMLYALWQAYTILGMRGLDPAAAYIVVRDVYKKYESGIREACDAAIALAEPAGESGDQNAT